jgi:pimeloyl-ACP methyl ester carboxylesterase
MIQQSLIEKAQARKKMHSVLINGSSFAYWQYASSSPNAKLLVFVHGYRGNHRGLEAIAGALGDYEIIIPDLPGFGLSSEITDHSIEGYVSWLGKFLEATKNDKPINLLGHSFGSIVVGNLARTQKLDSVILINPVSAPALAGPRAALTFLARAFYGISWMLPEKVGVRLLKLPLSVQIMSSVMAKTKSKELRSWIHKQHLDNFSDFSSVRVAVEGYRASVASNLTDYAAQISQRTLLIAGEKDDITSLSMQESASKLYPNAELKVIPEVGHLIHYEAPVQAAKLIRDFLEASK